MSESTNCVLYNNIKYSNPDLGLCDDSTFSIIAIGYTYCPYSIRTKSYIQCIPRWKNNHKFLHINSSLPYPLDSAENFRRFFRYSGTFPLIFIKNKILNNFNNIHLIKPLDYEPFIYLLKHSYLILTDSGGIQEEAPSLGKPVLLMREVTERPEAVKVGTVKIVGSDFECIVKEVSHLIDSKKYYDKMSRSHNPYGDGLACKRIVDVLRAI